MGPATRYLTLPSPLRLHRGGLLPEGRVAYETWGELNPQRDNAVLLLTGMSPGAHAASGNGDPQPGWWERMLGPGCPIDTRRWFVICVNSLGSCKGSTGPASPRPDGRLWRLDFPELALEDVASAAGHVVDHFGISQLAALIGPSMGGMTAQAYLLQRPASARRVLLISTAARAAPFTIAIRSLQREIIRRDPDWQGGEYPPERPPLAGMRLARKLGVISYRSAQEWLVRFGRQRIDPERRGTAPFAAEFEIESYLEGHAERFAGSFDPNCYLYLSRAMDWFDVAEHGGSLERGFARMQVPQALVLGVASDLLFPLWQQREIACGLEASGTQVHFHELDSIQGHDAFLVDIERFGAVIGDFLAVPG